MCGEKDRSKKVAGGWWKMMDRSRVAAVVMGRNGQIPIYFVSTTVGFLDELNVGIGERASSGVTPESSV